MQVTSSVLPVVRKLALTGLLCGVLFGTACAVNMAAVGENERKYASDSTRKIGEIEWEIVECASGDLDVSVASVGRRWEVANQDPKGLVRQLAGGARRSSRHA